MENEKMPNFADFVYHQAIKEIATELNVSELWLSKNITLTGDHRGLYYIPTVLCIIQSPDSIDF